MSEENVAVVEQMLRAFGAGEYEVALSVIDDHVEWEDPRAIPGGGVHHGRDGVQRWFARWLGAWEEFIAEPQEVIDAGDEVLVIERMRGRGRASGVEVDQIVVGGYEVRNGKIVRRRDYADKAEALEAAGLSR